MFLVPAGERLGIARAEKESSDTGDLFHSVIIAR
jgi:hypothetical protein